MICTTATCFADSEMIKYYQKTCDLNSESMKTKNYVKNYARYNTLENNSLWFTLGSLTYENIKINLIYNQHMKTMTL